MPADNPNRRTSLAEVLSLDSIGDEHEPEPDTVKANKGKSPSNQVLEEVEHKLEDSVEEAAATSALIWEAVLDGAVAKIISSFSWANSTCLNLTITLTFEEVTGEEDPDLIWINWLYFLFVTCVLILSAYKLQNYLNYEKKKVLMKLTVKDALPAMVIETEFDEFKKAFAKLFLDSLAIVCALALRAATTTSFADLTNVTYDDGYFQDDTSGLLGVTLIYAMLVTAIICWLSFKMGVSESDGKSTDTSNEKKDQNNKVKPLKEAAKTVSGLIIAFGWRGFFIVFIMSTTQYGDDNEDNVSGFWTEAIIITVLVTVYLSLLDLYSCCVPKIDGIPFQRKASEREYLSDILIASLQYVVGLSYVDAFVVTFKEMNEENEMIANWTYCGIMVVVLGISQLYLKKCMLGIASEVGGLLKFVDDNIDAINFTDELEMKDERLFIVHLRDNFIELSLFAISLSAGFSVSPAINVTIEYMLSLNSNTDTVLGSWIAVVCVFIVSTLLTLYLGTILKKARVARKNAIVNAKDLLVAVRESI